MDCPGKIIQAPAILLPNDDVDLTLFSVIACDQFTSQIEYWQKLEQLVGEKPSTLRMIFPEAYLDNADNAKYIEKINFNIHQYLDKEVLIDIGHCFILVERSTPYTKRRLGLMVAIDLDQYSYKRDSNSMIRASEATIIERIPPRKKIRENAPIELPHTLVLFDDPNLTIIEKLYKNKDKYPLIYDFDLNMDGGHLKGYRLDNIEEIIGLFERLSLNNHSDLMFVVGDGNHSLAAAKAHWEQIKKKLKQKDRCDHPSRYALVEAMNIYDEGLKFEGIHRIVFNVKDDFIEKFKVVIKGKQEGQIYTSKHGYVPVMMPENGPRCYQAVQAFIDEYVQANKDAYVDYVHGNEHVIEVSKKASNVAAIFMPSIAKEDLFPFVANGNVLTRKSFSMGEANEKRYYLEGKRISK
jgi:uncharacterized protein (DUF1015 family)